MERLQQKVKALRVKMGWAQEDLARNINVSLSTVQQGPPETNALSFLEPLSVHRAGSSFPQYIYLLTSGNKMVVKLAFTTIYSVIYSSLYYKIWTVVNSTTGIIN